MTTLTIDKICKELNLPFIAQNAAQLCAQAQRQQQSYEVFLQELLVQEYENRLERRSKRRIIEAKFPRLKTLESFDFSRTPIINEVSIRTLTEGHYIKKVEPIIFIGEPGTGKTHLATALGYSAAQSGKSVCFRTACQLVNQLNEAKDHRDLTRVLKYYYRYQLLIVDELGYLPLTKTDAELLFQLLSERHEKAPVIITTNLPFSEWTTIFNDVRLCKALIDRITHNAHIIETGEDSARFAETLKKFQKHNDKQY